jgi:hypothetical protein
MFCEQNSGLPSSMKDRKPLDSMSCYQLLKNNFGPQRRLYQYNFSATLKVVSLTHV